MAKQKSGRILSIDIGDKWLGIAVSDPLRLIASPVTAIRCETENELIKTVGDFIKEYDAGLLVIGFPRSLDGSTGPQALKIQRLSQIIQEKLKMPIVNQDERYSTSRAQEILARKKTRSGTANIRDDAIAAALILEDYLKSIGPSGQS